MNYIYPDRPKNDTFLRFISLLAVVLQAAPSTAPSQSSVNGHTQVNGSHGGRRMSDSGKYLLSSIVSYAYGTTFNLIYLCLPKRIGK